MKKQIERQRQAISQAIEASGVGGVHVTVIANDGTYLDGDVKSAAEEAIAVDAAIHAGAEKVIDGIYYPGAEGDGGHLDERRRASPSVTPHHVPAVHSDQQTPTDDPGLRILQAAHLDERLFSASGSSPVQTGTPID